MSQRQRKRISPPTFKTIQIRNIELLITLHGIYELIVWNQDVTQPYVQVDNI